MQQGMMIALPTTPRYKEKYMRNIDAANAARAFAADTAPSYISPVLLRFIASNAPLELDVFNELLSKSSSNAHLHRERKKGNARKDPIEALLSTIREYNKRSEQSPRGAEQQGPTQQGEKIRKGASERPAPNCARCAERFAKECGEKGCNKSIDKVGSEKGKLCTKDWGEKHTKEISSGKGRTCTKEFSKECSEKPRTCSRECAEKYRPGTGRVKHLKLPIRPLSARDNRMRETNLPERPRSARDTVSTGTTETLTRKRRKRRLRPISPREREQDSSSRETDLQRPVLSDIVRPASAGSCAVSERAKPIWFRQASLKALQALEKTLLAKLQLCTEHGDSWSLTRSKFCGKSHDMEQTSTSASKLKYCARKGEDAPRPGTAPAASSQAQASIGQNWESLSPRRRKPVDIEDLQQAGVAACQEQVDFPITRKFVETSIEKNNAATAPSACDSSRKSPGKDRTPAATEVKEELTGRSDIEDDDDFKDYIQQESCHDKEDEDFPSTCSSDYEDEDIVESSETCAQHTPAGDQIESKQLVINYDRVDDTPMESCIIKLKKAGHVSPEKGVSELFRGVHESLLVSSRLAEVVDLCCKRGQELLRVRESMAIEKPPEKDRWPFKLHRSKQSKANRRALRAELKWSIFSNGGKLRALNPIYGGGKRYLSNRIGFVSTFPEIL